MKLKESVKTNEKNLEKSDNYKNEFASEISFLCQLFEFTGFQNFNAFYLTKENSKEKPSIIRFAYMIFRLSLMVFIVVFFNFNVLTQGSSEIVETINILSIVEMGILVANLISVMVTILALYFGTIEMKKIYLIFNKIYNILRNDLSMKMNWSKTQNILILKYILLWIFLTILHFCPYKYYVDKELTLVASYIPMCMITYLTVFHYAFLVEVMNEFLKINSESILEVCELSHSKRNNHGSSSSIKSLEKEVNKRIRVCRYVYNKICEVCDIMNKIYGLSILLLFLFLVTTSTVSGYRIFVSISDGMSDIALLGKLCNFFLL